MAKITLKRKNTLVCIVCVLLSGIIVYTIFNYVYWGSDAEYRFYLEELCDQYANGKEVEGNLCAELCNTTTRILLKHLNSDGDKIVMIMRLNGVIMVVKSAWPHLSNYQSPGIRNIYSGNIVHVPSVDTFCEMVETRVANSLHVHSNISSVALVSSLWNMDFESLVNDESSRTRAMVSVWSLIQQDEYLLMKYLRNSDFIPDIYGSCGHFYAMEFSPPGKHLRASFPGNVDWMFYHNHDDWFQRATIAIQLLEMMRSFDVDFHERLHFCDTKANNFGITEEHRVKAIDVDIAFFETELHFQFDNTNCISNSDCHYFDCHGLCSSSLRRCLPIRTNNNLQVLCRKLFLGGVGLIASPPVSVKSELIETIRQCINPPLATNKLLTDCTGTLQCRANHDEYQRILFRSSQQISHQLRNILQKSSSGLS